MPRASSRALEVNSRVMLCEGGGVTQHFKFLEEQKMFQVQLWSGSCARWGEGVTQHLKFSHTAFTLSEQLGVDVV